MQRHQTNRGQKLRHEAEPIRVSVALALMFAKNRLLAHKRTMRDVWLVIPLQAGERIKSRAVTGMIYP
jgi:hypothetical protein